MTDQTTPSMRILARRPARSERPPLDFTPEFRNLESFELKPEPVRLKDCATWAYKLQDNSVELVAGCDADAFVMDPHADGMRVLFKPADVEAMKAKPGGGRKKLIAYMSIGEAEENRFYWESHWIVKAGGTVKPSKTAPRWLAAQNAEGWLDNFKVRYWDPDWQRIIVGEGMFLDRIVAAGFDGVYLDIIDGFYHFETKEKRKTARDEMIDFVARIARTARIKNPDFLVVPQNGEELFAQERYRDAVSAIGKEDILFNQKDGVDINKRCVVVRNKKDDIGWVVEDLKRAVAAGIPVLSVEYLRDDPENLKQIPATNAEVRGLGYVPYFADRMLRKLHPSMTPPAKPADVPVA